MTVETAVPTKSIIRRLLSPLVHSCYQLKFYADSINEPGAFPILYYFLFAIVLTLVQSGIILILNPSNSRLNNAPTITIKNSQAFSEELNTYYLIDNGKVLVAYDISEQLNITEPGKYDLLIVLQKNGISAYDSSAKEIQFTPYSEIIAYLYKGSDPLIIDETKLKEIFYTLILVTSSLLLVWNVFFRFAFLLIYSTFIYVILDIFSRKITMGFRQVLVIGIYTLIPTTYIIFFSSIITNSLRFSGLSSTWQLPIWLIIIFGLFRKYPTYLINKQSKDEEEAVTITIITTNFGTVNIEPKIKEYIQNVNLSSPQDRTEIYKLLSVIKDEIVRLSANLSKADKVITVEAVRDVEMANIELHDDKPDKALVTQYLSKARDGLKNLEPYVSLVANLTQLIASLNQIL